MPSFTRDALTLYYAERGNPAGPPVVLLHGLTLSSRMMERLASSLPDHRVLLLDLHGHGKSTSPRRSECYRVPEFARDVVALLDHLEIDTAVIGGLSLGANVAYEVAMRHPERVAALVLEMPVFARGVTPGRMLFTSLAVLLTAMYPVVTPFHPLIRRLPLPRRAYEFVFLRDLFSGDHLAQAALMWGISNDVAPPKDAATLSRVTMPVFVTAHPFDPVHSIDDATELVDGLANARRYDVGSLIEYGIRPAPINRAVAEFVRGLPTRPAGCSGSG
jgi:pimeloyl-ACP methyl ester carboxylesterase